MKEKEEWKAREVMENQRGDPGGIGPGAEPFQGLQKLRKCKYVQVFLFHSVLVFDISYFIF